MRPEDVYELTNVGDPRISLDGRRVAYVVTSLDRDSNEYRGTIWVASLDGSEEPRPFTSGERRDGLPRWSPDGRWLAFTSNRGDKEQKAQLYVIPAEGGEARRLTDLKEAVEDAVWSPDSTRLAFTARDRDEAYDEEDEKKRKPRRFTRVFFKLDSVGWTGDRRRHIWVVGLDGGEPRQLTDGDFEDDAPTWTPDGRRIVFTVEDRGNTHIYAADADGSAGPELLVGVERVVSGLDCRDGRLAFVASTYTTMRELYAGTEARRLTDVGRAFTERRELVEPERFTAVSKDGSEVDAWVVRPAGFEEGKRYPTLLSIHGGPFSQYGTGFFDEFQVYSGGGYVVLYSNPRGGSGHSEEWGRAIRGPVGGAGPGWGTVDYEDVTAVVDTALEKFDFVDPERLGVLGGSYGGFMTSWIIGHTNRFKAAISERGVNNLVSMFGSSDL